MNNNTNGLRTQYPYGMEALSPRPLYDFPSPTSNYPSGFGASPGFVPSSAFQGSPRFGSSVFIPPPDVFLDGRKDADQFGGVDAVRDFRARRSAMLNSDPVAMHLLVETAMGDSQNFDILSVEEVEALKQEQKVLDGKLNTVRKRLESETKIRDATKSLTRLTTKKNGHRRGFSSRGSNPSKEDIVVSDEGLDTINKKVDDLSREYLEIESRMRLIDAQLLMHTAGVLQLTHSGPTKKVQRSQEANGGVQRPDSPASIYNYESNRSLGPDGEDHFDDRSLYRSPENLDVLMNALQNGTHLHSETVGQQSQSLDATAKRLEDLNERLRELIVQANPEKNQEYALPPQSNGAPDASSMDQQLDFLDQGLRDMRAEHANIKNGSKHALNAVEGRLEGINNQLYALVSRNDEKAKPPPAISGGGAQEQLNYMEDSFYTVEQAQYILTEQIEDLRTNANNNKDVDQYETTLIGLWDIIRAGEEEARKRKQQRREMLAADPDADEELSPDEDPGPEQFSLMAFSAKVQMLYSRASSLKDKQSILVRQIKQQRELNSRSDAQKEEQFDQLKEQVLSARSEKASMEKELERAMGHLKEFDQQKVESDSKALREAEQQIESLEMQLKEFDREKIEAESRALDEAEKRIGILEKQLKAAQEEALVEAAAIQTERSQDSNNVNEAKAALKAAIADKEAIQAELSQVSARANESDNARRAAVAEKEAISSELDQAAGRLDEVLVALRTASSEREAAEARSTEATKNLKAKEDELSSLESEVVRLTTELTFAKAELDGAYGTRAERAAESAASPELKKELEDLVAKNASMATEIQSLRKMAEAASQSEAEARDSERNLKQELSGMASEYEQLTRDSIQNEKDRESLEASIDKLRDDKEALEMEISDERVKWLGVRSPSVANGAATIEATSIRMLREDFRKMMRDRTAEGLKALRNEQEERRKLEALIRTLRKESAPQKSSLSKSLTPA
ncbi:hypothetical protein BU24DRAFT_416426 [Aaosphaeria arxii CBS 175.79]|uniref:Uncharacterized protein n=1 Tax=Aaosphaeria arxii CBS 175.79 TaxID=1450172 RepID=A0A6A5Y616_9PLEO|nr:uncharacterized protein BU24DRAFT_416426 [Aaosphaeria arxii CBS 175.79]KAF2020739.1 hypothetical protein BU24DRAFT_416426 [Aaosphaeria arxii CBS 175.79]